MFILDRLAPFPRAACWRGCAALVLSNPAASVTTTAEAEALAEKMLRAVGGRANWAAIRNTVHDAQQFRVDVPNEVRGVITMDFERPRFRIDTTAPGLRVARAIDGDRDWRLTRDGTLADVPAATRSEDLRWYAAHVYRTIARIAKRDPAISVSLASDGRLQVSEGGKRIAWYRLNSAGEPFAYGAHDDERGSLAGPWKYELNGIRHPVWTSSVDGTFRASINVLKVNVELDDAVFSPPAGAIRQASPAPEPGVASQQPLLPDLAAINDARRWKNYNLVAAAFEQDGRRAVSLTATGDSANGIVGLALPVGVDFETGVIELELKGKSVRGRSFLGVAFNVIDDKTFEAVYFRPFNFKAEGEFRDRAVQYISWPANTWENLRKHRTGQFENAISPVPDPDSWFRARIEVTRDQVRVFVNRAMQPTLAVTRLAASRAKRSVGLFVDSADGLYANVRILPDTQ